MGRRIRELEEDVRNLRASRDSMRGALDRRDQAAKDVADAHAARLESLGRKYEADIAQLHAQLDEAGRIVRLLVGKLLRTGMLGEIQKPDVKISESEARRIMADERRPVVMHDQLTGKTVVRLVRPGNPAPWEDPR